MSDKKYGREYCLALLREKHTLLQAQGLTRYPQRSDFEQSETAAIKAFFGPWGRALEAAGIKPPRNDDKTHKTAQKRILAKRRINAMRKENKKRTHSDEQDPPSVCDKTTEKRGE